MNAQGRSAPSSRGTIVVADDDFATRMMLCQILGREHFNVVAVENGRLACEAVRRERPDVVVLDCMMPIMDGRAALHELKANKDTRNIPVVMLTTQSRVAQKVGALEDGAQDYLTKPFDGRELVARIEQQMDWRSVLAVDADAVFRAERVALLAGSERRYRLLAEAMPQMIWTADRRGEFNYWNCAWYRYTGTTFEQTQNGGWSAVVHAEDRVQCVAAWSASLQTGEAYEVEYRLRRASDGVYRWHLGRATPVRNGANAIVEWIGSCTDIHDFKVASEMRDVLDTVPHIVWMHDDAGFVHYLNPRWSQYTGATSDAGFGLGWHDFIHPADLALIDKRSADSIAMSATAPASDDELRIRGRDGRYRWFLTRTAVLSQGLGHARRWVSTSTDIHDSKHSQALLISSEARYRAWSTSLQRALLPPRLPTIPGCRFDAVYEPGECDARIGGDWYDAIRLTDGRILVSIGDVAGSGHQAAAVMGVVRQTMRGIAQLHADPALMLDAADRALRLEYPDVFATAWVGIVDPVTRSLIYASAGHPPSLLALADGKMSELTSGALPLGLGQGHQDTATPISLPDDSTLVLYTDGLTEADHDVVAGDARVHAAVAHVAAAPWRHPASEIQAHVLDQGASDDVAILVVRFDFAEIEQHLERLTFDVRDACAARHARGVFQTTLSERRFTPLQKLNAELVFRELIGNVLRHVATCVEAEVIIDCSGPQTVLHVLDRGSGFRHVGRLPSDLYSESGRGLFLIAEMTDDFTVSERPGGGSHARAVLIGPPLRPVAA